MTVDIRQTMTDPALLGEQFGGESWAAWRALLSGFYGLTLDDDEASTGRHSPAAQRRIALTMSYGWS